MTFVIESFVAASLLCATVPPRRYRLPDKTHCIQYTSGEQTSFHHFQMLSGTSLEERMEIEIREIEGVSSVHVVRDDDSIDVNVYLDTFEFDLFDKVVQEELSLTDEFPHIRFSFNIMPKTAIDADSSIRHAA